MKKSVLHQQKLFVLKIISTKYLVQGEFHGSKFLRTNIVELQSKLMVKKSAEISHGMLGFYPCSGVFVHLNSRYF